MPIRVIAAFSNRLLSEGVAKLIEDDDNFNITLCHGASACSREDLESSDVILTDLATLDTFPEPDPSKKHGFILIDTGCGRDKIISAIMKKNLSGVLLSDSNLQALKKAIRSVARGEVWIDRTTVKDLLDGFNMVKPEVLSEKEKEIVALVGKGLRNREVALRLGISELTVKTHLHRIFRKLDIRARSELIKYAVKSLSSKALI